MNHHRNLTVADMVTISNGLLGFLAITYIVDGRFFDASITIIICIGIDGMDGVIARYMGTSHRMGAYLDLFSDAISFCFAPALLVYSNYYDKTLGRAWESNLNMAATLVPMMMVFFGVLRLSRFAHRESTDTFYNGLPVPAMALMLVLLISLLGSEMPFVVLTVAVILSSMLYSTLPYPKLRGRRWMLPGMVMLTLALFGEIFAKISYSSGPILLLAALVMCAVYIMVGPITVGYRWIGKQNV